MRGELRSDCIACEDYSDRASPKYHGTDARTAKIPAYTLIVDETVRANGIKKCNKTIPQEKQFLTATDVWFGFHWNMPELIPHGKNPRLYLNYR